MSNNLILNPMKILLVIYALSGLVNAQTYTISGEVIDYLTDPVESVTVQVYWNNNPVGGANDVTDNSGQYSIAGLPAATYDIDFQPLPSSGLRPKYVTEVVVEGDITLDVTLPYANKISGYVRNSTSQGIPDIDLNVYYQFSGDQIDTPGDNTDSNGYYDIFIPDGTYRIVYRPVGGESYASLELENVVITDDTIIDVVLEDGYFVSGVVTGPGAVPVVGADLDAEDSFTGEEIYTPGDNTDGSGFYQLTLPQGVYDINVMPLLEDYLVPGIVYDVSISSDTVINFNLEAGIFLSGTVRDPGGFGVFDGDLDIRDYTTGAKLYTPSDNTDSSGNYQIIIPSGSYNIDYGPPVLFPYLASLRLTNIIILADTVIDVTVPYGYLLSGVVQNSIGTGVPNIDIDAVDASNFMSVPLVGDFTDGSGAFATVIVGGTYHIEIEPPFERRLAAKKLSDFMLSSDTSIIAALDTGIVVSGTAYDSVAMPLPDVKINAIESSSQQPAYIPGNKTDVLGYYEVLIRPETYNLVYIHKTGTGIEDSVAFNDVAISSDTTIDVFFTGDPIDTIPPTITLNSPNGGENWETYSYQTISWSASDNIEVTSIDIFYSVNGISGPFSQISVGEINDGVYTWHIPADTSEDVYVKVIAHDSGLNSSEDISDSPFIIFQGSNFCFYVPGDVNGDGNLLGSDIVYGVNYFRGTGNHPPDSCWNDSTESWLYSAADGNGNCQFIGSDITFLINYYRGHQPIIYWCPQTPPSGFLQYDRKKGANFH